MVGLQAGHLIHQTADLTGSQVNMQTFVLRKWIQMFDVELGVEQRKIKLV